MWTRNLRKGEHPLNICEGTERMTYFLIWVKLQKQHIYVHSSTCNLVLNALSHNFLWTIVFQNMHLSFLKKQKKSFTSMISVCVCVVHSPSGCVMCSSQSRSLFKVAGSSLSSIPASVQSALYCCCFFGQFLAQCPFSPQRKQMSLLSTEKTNVPIIP